MAFIMSLDIIPKFPMHLRASICTLLLIIRLNVSAASNSITYPEFLKNPETLISSNGRFKLGFFNNSRNQYLGIWMHNNTHPESSLQVIWVANRDTPVKDSSPMLEFSDDGNLQVVDEQNKIYWSSNVSDKANSSSSAQLQNTDNLVLLANGSDSIIWQSFDYPADSLMPGQKLSFSKSLTETKTLILSWKTSTDPASGRFRMVSLPRELPEFFILEGDKPFWRSGPWNGYLFLGVPLLKSESVSGFNIDDNNNTVEISYKLADQSVYEWYVLTYDGCIAQKLWNDSINDWGVHSQTLDSQCDVYGNCGKFAVCDPRKGPICECLKGFIPEKTDEWGKGNWTNGCVRRTELQCRAPGSKEDKFMQLKHIKVPDYAHWIQADAGVCQRNCMGNCSCLAYSYYSGVGCMLWTADLIDLQQYSVDGADLFIRLANSELPDETGTRKITIAAVVILSVSVSIISMLYLWKWMHHRNGKRTAIQTSKEAHWKNIFGATGSSNDFQDVRLFDFTKLSEATDNFSETNKLGKGGFGPVYKGKWEDGQEIAVKRLSSMSGQGTTEFMNEVKVISKLQHKNLVKLLGCCVQGEEKLLVYELLPNNSLDVLLFNSEQQKVLDWPKRFNIIKGICRGLLYLHKDSRPRIIHRDLKPSNILLDEELNPKISDFGMARIFGSKQDEANTLRVVGTYGYMSPEYAMEGTFSEKSDVFSLGVLVIEIISGKRNHKFGYQESMSLLTYAWKLWNENNMPALINPEIIDQRAEGEIFKSIQVGLLCVQELPADRPDVSALISMFDADDIKTLPIPKQPGFTGNKSWSSDGIFQNVLEVCSVNSVSMTAVSGR